MSLASSSWTRRRWASSAAFSASSFFLADSSFALIRGDDQKKQPKKLNTIHSPFTHQATVEFTTARISAIDGAKPPKTKKGWKSKNHYRTGPKYKPRLYWIGSCKSGLCLDADIHGRGPPISRYPYIRRYPDIRRSKSLGATGELNS